MMMFNTKNFMLMGLLCLSAGAFAQNGKDKPKTPNVSLNLKKYIDPANMDPSAKPGDDFFEYANGAWVKNNPIPAKETRWGSFGILHQENTDRLKSILTDVSKTPGQPKGSLKQRVGDLYASGIDSVAIEKRGYDPIKPDLERVSKINNLDGVVNEAIYERTHGIGSPLFGFGVGQDSKHPTVNILNFGQGGTSLPDRDNYLKNDERTKKIQAAYKNYIVTLFKLTGTSDADAAKNAETIFNIETAFAKAQLSRVAMRDPNKTYNKFAVKDFQSLTPHLKWDELLPLMEVKGQDTILVSNPAFYKATDALLASTPVDDWKTYLTWNVLKGSASSLSSPFEKASFAFSSALSGQKVQAPRDERAANLVDGSLGELLGQIYVEKYFKPAAKEYMVKLVNNLKETLGERIQGLSWMSAETKARALKKLAAFTVKIGYPDKWQNYDGLEIDRNDYAGNLRRISEWRYNYNVSQLGKPVDKTRWGMSPPTVNAYYSPTNNEIVFPAGILQFPFFDFNADDAVNYGGIGSVIGHEMTHGFDDQGRQYDADGTLRDWWTKDDADKFKSRADQVVNQYNKFTVVDTIHVNGKLTLGENLADLGGLNVAYAAFKKTKEGHSNQKIDGFTPDQRFFLSWAQVWRSSQRPEAAAQRILTDPHSPEQYRTNAPITNIDAWYKAFNVKPGDKMYKKPEDRTKVW
ncbi:M13 family metallopeptidase [Mucilaginibacter sp. L3T2-6]|uniref:M13 family metallopeptidase n=1 Tax=Mucilaginibacter sp. L3T2-6 TaxID=3062491 RepID=UPI00267713FA|nr:M13 family metallopeptidase [Mucilaginibacter sp. L3T2-6]MDO3642533.1 M13 family metallopeptidase [Mucilaginibacter sp. L3T2-6]MDV6215071.1 M13 family metallopeptidase [Mucilaginibacter sp. L3T2-6]